MSRSSVRIGAFLFAALVASALTPQTARADILVKGTKRVNPHAILVADRFDDYCEHRVTIRAGGRTFTRELHAGSSYLSSDEPAVHAGLGGAERIDEVTVRWPGGPVETFTNLPVNRRMTLRRGDSTVPQPPPPAPVDPPLIPAAGVTPASASAGS